MNNVFQKIPFLRIALALAIGIIGGRYFTIPSTISILCLSVLVFSLYYLNKNYNYKISKAFGLVAIVLFFLFGNLIYTNYNKSPLFFEKGIYYGTILESPQEKQNSYKSVIQLHLLKAADSVIQTNEKVLVYFAKSKAVQSLKSGANIVFQAKPQFIKNYGNPYEFDYKSYLQNKRIYRQVYLTENNWELTSRETKSLQTYSENFREKLLSIYHEQNLGANETEILSALTLGYKRNLDPETKRIFSAAGAMHVLAVSGLHVGILFMVFTSIFGFLRKRKTGKYFFVTAAIMLLWSYAFITGLSPSVMRASTMFSIVIIGTNMNRRASIYNSLAASAFFLLLINPNNLFEVGFQLSYSAVFGIVFLQPKIEKIWIPKNRVIKFFWTLLTVSIAAQLATFPLTSFYFNQFPTYFWLSNLIIIPAVTLLIPMGILLLIVSKIQVVSLGLAFVINWLIKTIYSILQSIEHFPYSLFEISLSPIQLSFLLLFLFLIFVFIESPKASHLKLAFSALSILFIAVLLANLKQYHAREIIVYNNSSNTTIHLIAGRINYVISRDSIYKDDFLFRQIQDVKRKKGLATTTFLLQEKSFEDEYLFNANGFSVFEGKSIFYGNAQTHLSSNFLPDILISETTSGYLNHLFDTNTQIVATQKDYKNNQHSQIHLLNTVGAYQLKW